MDGSLQRETKVSGGLSVVKPASQRTELMILPHTLDCSGERLTLEKASLTGKAIFSMYQS
jgi:hypothetical protein